MDNKEKIAEEIREKVRNQYILDYVRKCNPTELEILIKQFETEPIIIDEELVSLSDIHSFLLLEKLAGNNIKETIQKYFYECNFEDLEYLDFIDTLTYKELILADTILKAYSSPALLEINGILLSDLIKLLIIQSRKNNELVRVRRNEKNEIEQ